MRYQEQRLSVGRSVDLFIREFRPDYNEGRTCVLLHGASEHGGRHQHVAERLCRSGWRIIVPDLRGHGRSDGRPMHVSRFGQYVDDLARVYDSLRLDPDSTVQQGYSLGGLVTARFAQRHAGRTRAISLTCPLLGLMVQIPRLLYASGQLLSVAYPWKRFASVIDPADVTRCAISIAERRSDPLYRHGVTAGWFFAVRRAIGEAWRDATALTAPVLLVQSGDDRIVDADANRSWLAGVGSIDTHFQDLPNHFHEWHYEPTWARTTDQIGRWLAARLDGAVEVEGLRRAA